MFDNKGGLREEDSWNDLGRDLNFKKHIEDRVNRGFKSFVCVEVLRPSQPSGVMSSAVSLPNHTFTGQA